MENFVSIGFRFGILVSFWIMVALLVLTLLMALAAKRDSGPHRGDTTDSPWFIGVIAFGIFGAIAACFFVGGLAPFDSKYHHAYRVTGEVKEVSNVLSDSGGDLTRTPVLTMEGVDRDIVMDDPRAVNLKGKSVDLTCTVNWAYQGADEYKCIIYKIHDEELTPVNP